MMNLLEVCQEIVAKSYISPDHAKKLDYMLWHHPLNNVELATLRFISQCIEMGKIAVSSEPISYSRERSYQLD